MIAAGEFLAEGVGRLQLSHPERELCARLLEDLIGEEPRSAAVAGTAEEELLSAVRGAALDDRLLLRAAHHLTARLPRRLVAALWDIRYTEALAALVVSGAPNLGKFGPTPPRWGASSHESIAKADRWLLLLCAELGDPVTWGYLQEGALVNDLLPMADRVEEDGENGSRLPMTLHVDEAFADERGDAFGLVCLRNDDRVPTRIAPLAAADLDREDAEVLRECRFVVEAHGDQRLRPILAGGPEAAVVRLDASASRAAPGDTRAARALEALLGELERVAVDVALKPGEVLLVDNHRCVHGRPGFRASFDGSDRWLRRLTVVRDLRPTSDRRGAGDLRVLR